MHIYIYIVDARQYHVDKESQHGDEFRRFRGPAGTIWTGNYKWIYKMLFFTQTKCFADAIPGIVARSSWARGGKKNLCMCGCDDYRFWWQSPKRRLQASQGPRVCAMRGGWHNSMELKDAWNARLTEYYRVKDGWIENPGKPENSTNPECSLWLSLFLVVSRWKGCVRSCRWHNFLWFHEVSGSGKFGWREQQEA